MTVHPPFSAAEFFAVFQRYNETVWPAQPALVAFGLLTALAAYRANTRRSWPWAQLAIGMVAALWLWTGIAYHKAFFAMLTPAGEIFASIFIAEAGLLLISVWQNGSSFERASRASIVTGTLLIGYALLLYPAIGTLLGHHYPAMPTFGTPCPTTIFTFGIFCLLPASIPRFAVAIPVLWMLIASSAAVSFGVYQDFGLVVAVVAAIAVMHHETHHPFVTRLVH